MTKLFFISHPEVVIDPAIDVTRWRLSDTGRARMQAFAQSHVVERVAAVWSSTETKAMEAGGILAQHLGLSLRAHAGLHENDRSATGYLSADQFEQVTSAFFANPETSIRGWERALDAQRRIRRVVDALLSSYTEGDLAIVSHGAVGTLLLCAWLGRSIDRSLDQPSQGHYWTATMRGRRIVHGWTPIAA